MVFLEFLVIRLYTKIRIGMIKDVQSDLLVFLSYFWKELMFIGSSPVWIPQISTKNKRKNSRGIANSSGNSMFFIFFNDFIDERSPESRGKIYYMVPEVFNKHKHCGKKYIFISISEFCPYHLGPPIYV